MTRNLSTAAYNISTAARRTLFSAFAALAMTAALPGQGFASSLDTASATSPKVNIPAHEQTSPTVPAKHTHQILADAQLDRVTAGSSLSVVATLASAPTITRASYPPVLAFGDIPGESTDKDHRDWIMLRAK
jgi:hypothetical protein